MKPASFTYDKTTSIQEAVAWLDSHPEGKLVAGGQSLIPLMNFRLSRPEQLLDITDIPHLADVSISAGTLSIGSLIRHQALYEHEAVRERLPVLTEAAGNVGHWAIRNRGTLGGSLAHADPAAELPAAMVALNASFHLVSTVEERDVDARDFYLGFLMTDLQPGELLTQVNIPLTDTRFGFDEIARRPGDFALAGAFAEVVEGGSGALTWFGISGGPDRREIAWPKDANHRKQAIFEQIDTVDILDDVDYRRQAAWKVAEKAYEKANGRNAQ